MTLPIGSAGDSLTHPESDAGDDADCPEMCDHGGRCAEERAAIAHGEWLAETAIERYLEGGWDVKGEYAYDPNDPFGNREETLVNGSEYHGQFINAPSVPWTAPGLKITRLRLVTDPGFTAFDVSYCHGELGGKPVRVQLPFGQLPKRGLRRAIVEAAQRDGVYAVGLGIFDAVSTLS